MKKIFIILLAVVLIRSVSPTTARAEIPAKAKAFLVVSAYGTVGGALLGFATMAYGTNSRAIAQGASLGLYAGLIFGAYVLASHKSADDQINEYEQQYGPEGAPPPDGMAPGGWGAPPSEEEGGGFFGSPQRAAMPPIYLNFLHVNF